jgi:phosphate transport system substrate-binding protein
MKAGLLGAAGIALAALLPGELQVAVDPALPSYRPTGVVGVAATLVGPYWLARSVIALALKFNELEPRASVRVLAVAGAEAKQTMPAAAPAMIRFDEVLTGPELAQFEQARGHQPLRVRVALGHFDRDDGPTAIGIYVHKDNPLDKLTLAQLDAVFSRTRARGYAQDITRWGELGLKGDWAEKPINLYGRPADHNVGLFFQERVLKGGERKSGFQGKTPSPAVLASVAGDRYGIGYAGLGYGLRNPEGIRLVALAEEQAGPYIAAEPGTVVSGTYPLVRYISMFLDRVPGQPVDPMVKEFLRFVWSREGQDVLLKQGYLPMSPKTVEEERARVERP